jgi:hypothetical protein
MSLGIHIISFPSGRFGYVGTLPRVLGSEQPASGSDIMGGRAYRNAAGDTVVTKFPSFVTAADAVAHARSRDVALCASPTCACRKLF